MGNDSNVDGKKEPSFDADRAEFFEAIGHPVRIRIIQLLGQKRLGFTGLKKEVGIDSSGHLSFHLDKLSRMVTLGGDGLYTLTAQGYDALRMVDAVRQSGESEVISIDRAPSRIRSRWTVLMAVLVIGIVLLAGVAVFQQIQINAISGGLQVTVTTTSTVTLIGTSSSSGGGTEIVNGTMKVAFLESGVSANTAWYNVRNDGGAPLYIEYAFVNGALAFLNGTGGQSLAVNNNPIPPGETATVTAIYPIGTSFSPGSTIRFTLVSAEGLEVSDQIELFGGIVSTTTTTAT